jgi:hypothetical protein
LWHFSSLKSLAKASFVAFSASCGADMLEILLVIIAIVVSGACLGRSALRLVRGNGSGWQSMVAFQQTYGAQSLPVGGFWPARGDFCSCRHMAVAAALARPAPRRMTASLDGWSSGG